MAKPAAPPAALPAGTVAPLSMSTTQPIDDRMLSRLPLVNQPWPPPELDPVAYMHRIWSAWWTGDRQMLAWTYYNLGANSPYGRAFFSTTGESGLPTPKPGQYRGGLLGSIEYSFWGQPVAPGEKRTRLHVPIASDIAQTSASLLFSSPPELKTTLTGAQGAVNQAWLDSLIDDGFHRRLLEAAEMGAGLGGVYLRVVWDLAVSKQPWIQPVPADVVVPEFSYDKLMTATFWRVLEDQGDKVIRHLEMHAPGQNLIQHGIYEGDQTDLGEPVPLGAHDATKRLAGDLQGDTLVLPDLPFDAASVVYIPNLTPNKIWRDLGPQLWPLGRSDYCGIEPIMDQLDEAYSSWMRDVQLGVTRLMVPQEYLDDIGKGKGAVFEPDRRVFIPLNIMGGDGDGKPQITANQFVIRWQEHSETCQALINRCVMGAGYSPQTFGDYQGNAPTATEIEARERISQLTRKRKINYWRPGLQDAIYSLMAVSRQYFGATAIEPERPDINFAAVALPDEAQLAQTASLMAQAEAASKRTLVRTLHPDWTDTEVDAEVATIFEEIGSELFAHAKLSLATPPGEPIAQQVAELSAEQPAPAATSTGTGDDADNG